MDKEELERINGNLQSMPCPFEKTLLALRCQCTLHRKIFVAEREGLQCTVPDAYHRCHDVLTLAHGKSRFAFGLRHDLDPLPHRKQMRLQAAVLSTLTETLYGDENITTVDISVLLAEALRHYQKVDNLPVTDIVRKLAK